MSLWGVCLRFAAVMLPVMVVFAARASAGDPPPTLKIGLPESMFHGVPPAVVGPASRPFQSMFEKQTGLKGEVVVAKDYDDVTKQLPQQDARRRCLPRLGIRLSEARPRTDSAVRRDAREENSGGPSRQSDSKVIGAKDLKGDCVVVPKATKAHCRAYFNHLKEQLPGGCCKREIEDASVEEARSTLWRVASAKPCWSIPRRWWATRRTSPALVLS